MSSKRYKKIYDRLGYIVSYVLEGDALHSETGFHSIAGVVHEGRLSRSAIKKKAKQLAEGHSEPVKPASKNNLVLKPSDLENLGGAKTKFKNNVKAIELLKQLEIDDRKATTEEQQALSQYVGWGGIPQAFVNQGKISKGWEKQAKQLKALLNDKEYQAAIQSTQNAHYTSPEIINAIYQGIEQFGFTGGKVLESSLGVGHFFGLMPSALRVNTRLTGVELDSLTGRMAKKLYPEAHVLPETGFQDFKVSDGTYDLAIGNPPFGSEKIYDADKRHLKSFSIHNFFFAKSLDLLKPNALLGMVVSNSLLDAASTKARQYLADRAELVGAIRLPNNAFLKNAGTEVTTDIIFLRKLAEGETSNKDWVNTGVVADALGGKDIPVNEYFIKHPEMMLGQMERSGSMYRGDMSALVAKDGQDTPKLLREAVKSLSVDKPVANGRREQVSPDANKSETVDGIDTKSIRVGSMFVADDDVHIRKPDQENKVQSEKVVFTRKFKGQQVADKKGFERVKGMIKVRDAFADLRKAQLNPEISDGVLRRKRKVLSNRYDSFVKQHGPINHATNKRLFVDDPSFPQISALEDKYDKGLSPAMARKTGEKARKPSAKKAAVFTVRTQRPVRPITKVNSAKDALIVSLSEFGVIRMEHMERLYSKPTDTILKELKGFIFHDPVSQKYVTRDEYLSGDVKHKLERAKYHNENTDNNNRYAENIKELEAVQPEDIEAVDIDVKMGSGWLPNSDMIDFIKHITGDANAKATYVSYSATWDIRASHTDAGTANEWGTDRRSSVDLITSISNQKAITVKDTFRRGDGSTYSVVNEKSTLSAKEKEQKLKGEFAKWIWADDTRRERLARIYNDTYNTDVLRVYDGDHLIFNGKISDDVIKLRPHQANGAWRMVQGGTHLLDHVVGAGKTFTAIAGVMEMRRMGLADKPMLLVPNHLVGQWATDVLKLYPSANVLAATKKDFKKDNRKRLFARIATGDWDAVIVPHSSFKFVEVEPEYETKFIEGQINEIDAATAELKREEGKAPASLKQMAKRRDNLKAKIKKLMDSGRKDDSMYWQELGVDALVVDEAHEFKNLGFATGMQRVAGLGNPMGSQKATDLFMKSQALLERTGGRNLTFMTGTPISNTMAEMFTMQRYLDYDDLKSKGLVHFDAWAKQFGEVVSDWELSPAGKYKLNSRFAKFVNMPELMQKYLGFADVITRDDIQRQLKAIGSSLPIPSMKGGRPNNIIVDRSNDQADYIGEPDLVDGKEVYPKGSLVWRSENLPTGQPKKGDDNMLKVMSDARKAALDMRLIDPSYPDNPESKVNVSADNIHRLYKKWDKDKGTQLVFIDLSTPKKSKGKEAARLNALIKKADEGDEKATEQLDNINPDEFEALNSNFSVYDDLKAKLVSRGIPENEIAFIHDANTDLQKDELFGKVRSGAIRVLLGSSAKMGAGMNVQERLVALTHLDAPWRPSDLQQREGRIIRQGNVLYERDPDNFEVEVLRFATKSTLDSRMWQTIESKARFIEQVRKGNLKNREVEDIGAESANAAEMKAASSGNPLILKEMELRTEIRKLEGLASEHDREQHGLRNQINRIERDIPANEKLVKRHVAESEYYKKNKPVKGFSAKIKGKTHSKRKDAGVALLKEVNVFVKSKKSSAEVGSINGFSIHLDSDVFSGLTASLEHDLEFQISINDIAKTNAVGLVTRLDNSLKGIDKEGKDLQQKISTNKNTLPKLKKQLRPFDKQVELDKASAERVAIIQELQAEGKEDSQSDNDVAENKPKFSLQNKTSLPLDHVKLDAVVNRVTSAWRNSPDIVTVETFEGLPVEILQAAHEQNAELSEIAAVQHGDKVYVVANKMYSARQVEETLFHEVYGHYGIRGLFGSQTTKKLNQLFMLMGGRRGFKRLAKKYGLTKQLQPYVDGTASWDANARNSVLADELLAHVAQHETGKLKQRALEVLGSIRQWLRDHGFAELGKFGRADIAHLLKQSRDSVREGDNKSGKDKPDIRFSLQSNKQAPPSEGLVGSGVSEKEASELFKDDGDYDGKEGVEWAKDKLAKSYQWVADNLYEFSKNGGFSTVTLRQLVDLTKRVLPSGERYLRRVERMLTRRNQMQDEAAKIAMRWNALHKMVKHRMATVMHQATTLGVDPSEGEFKLSESLVKGGMKRARFMAGLDEYRASYKDDDVRVEVNAKNLSVLAQQKRKTKATWRKARNKDTAGLAEQDFLRAVDEWRNMRNGIARDKKRRASYPKLRRMYLALPSEAQKLFTESRDMYVTRSNETEVALLAQIGLLEGLGDNKKKVAISMIRHEFESARLQGVYFPLFRKGDYFVKAKRLRDDLVDGQQTYTKLVKNNNIVMETDKKTGEQRYKAIGANVSFATYEEAVQLSNKWGTEEAAIAAAQSRADLLGKNLIAVAEGNGFVLKDNPYENIFMMAQSAAEAERLAGDLNAESQNTEVKHGKLNKMQTKEDFAVSGSFLSDLMGTLKKGNVSEGMQDEVYQLYLNTLPELSQRKHFIHRKKVEGFSDNALQAFSNNMMHQAHQISKLEAREELTQIQADVAEEAATVHQDDAIIAGNARDELKQRHEWVMNPNNASWTNKTSAFGFFMYLGVSPAAALVNLTQTAIVAYPSLAAKFGWKAATREFLRAGKQLNMRETVMGEDAIDRKLLTKDEQEALDYWHDTGVIDRSQAHMLAGIGDSDNFQNSPTYQKWMGRTAHLFHKAEIVNRETTLLAAYRLARDSKEFKSDPREYAADVTWESQFDYSNANRARLMQGDIAKLFLMFKSYSQHMIYFLLRNANQWGKGKDADGGVKAARESKVKLLGILGMTLAMGGVTALPIGLVGGAAAYQYVSAKHGRKAAVYGTGGMLALIAIAATMDDEDEPWDIETEVRSTLRGWGGDNLEALVMRGGLNAATGIDISSRISLDDLLIREPNRELEGRDAYIHYLQQAVGPVLAKAGDIGFMAPALWADDHGYRALEKASPKFARDIMKSLRYGSEGALNYRGDAIVEKDLMSMYGDELNVWNVFWQSQGFSPEKVSRQYLKTNDLKGYESVIKERKSKLLSKYFIQYIENDQGGMSAVLREVQRYNRANPNYAINQKTIKRSMETRMRYRRESIHGASVTKRLRYLIDELNIE